MWISLGPAIIITFLLFIFILILLSADQCAVGDLSLDPDPISRSSCAALHTLHNHSATQSSAHCTAQYCDSLHTLHCTILRGGPSKKECFFQALPKSPSGPQFFLHCTRTHLHRTVFHCINYCNTKICPSCTFSPHCTPLFAMFNYSKLLCKNRQISVFFVLEGGGVEYWIFYFSLLLLSPSALIPPHTNSNESASHGL